MADPYSPTTLSAFDTAQQQTEVQRKALLDAVASGGAAGAQAYQQQQAQNQAMRQQAVANAAGAAQGSPLGLVQGGLASLQAPVARDAALRDAELGQAQSTLQNDLARQQSSGDDYFNRMQQAIPVTESRTRMGVEQIIREQEEAARERALQMQMAELQLQGQRESVAAQREARAFENQMRQQELAARNNPKLMDPMEREQLAALKGENRRNAELDALETAIAGFGKGNPDLEAAIAAMTEGGSPPSLSTDLRRDALYGAKAYFDALGEEYPPALRKALGIGVTKTGPTVIGTKAGRSSGRTTTTFDAGSI